MRGEQGAWDRYGIIARMLREVALPPLGELRQAFPQQRIEDPEGAVAAQLGKREIAERIRPGMRVAISVGSRGVAQIDRLTGAVVRELAARGAQPFIVPAMGSHGGATAEGQRELLTQLGVTEERVGAPIVASMETVQLGETESGKRVYLDARAAEADGIVVMGRVKPHTAFRGEYESGLLKMMAIGLGKHTGAMECHSEGFGRMAEYLPAYGRVILSRAPILCGLAVVENGYDQPYRIEAIAPEAIMAREPELLREAFSLMPSIPFRRVDVLVVRRIGKNISGDGMDPNITGTFATPFAEGGPEVGRSVVLDLTEETHGNGLGVGMADFTTARLFSRLDLDAMYPNSLTSTVLGPSRIPIIMKDEETAVKAALYTCNGCDRERPRVVMIRDTLQLDRLWISPALAEEARSLAHCSAPGDFLDWHAAAALAEEGPRG